MCARKPKGFGRGAQIEGLLVPGQRVLLVEDLATDGKSKVNFINALREAGGICDHCFVIFFYDIYPQGKKIMGDLGVTLHALTTWRDVLAVAESERQIRAEDAGRGGEIHRRPCRLVKGARRRSRSGGVSFYLHGGRHGKSKTQGKGNQGKSKKEQKENRRQIHCARARHASHSGSPSAITARKISTTACAPTPPIATSASRRRPSGMVQAHVIRMTKPFSAEEVAIPHYHDVDFQMVYVLKGWFRSEFEGQGAHTFHAGACWIQPPKIKHTVRGYSDDCELLEIVLAGGFRDGDPEVELAPSAAISIESRQACCRRHRS